MKEQEASDSFLCNLKSMKSNLDIYDFGNFPCYLPSYRGRSIKLRSEKSPIHKKFGPPWNCLDKQPGVGRD